MAEAKRRLAAILAADVAGYSRLMGADEEHTIAALNDRRAIFRTSIEVHHGRVVDTAGDSVLATFDSVVEAVRSASEVQAAIAERNRDLPEDRQMAFRIGVNSGDVVEQDDGTIYGDGVNIAARLEALAEPGGIVVSEDAFRNVRNRTGFGFDDLGAHTVKNIADPVRAYRLTPSGAAPTPPPLAGRARSRRVLAGIGAITLVIAALVAWQSRWFLEHGREIAEQHQTMAEADPILALPSGPSIAVLPFENLSGNSDQEYFADGLTEEIITALTRFDGLAVIARNSTFQYKGQAADVREVGRALGARYVVEGSVRTAAGIIRVTTQLLDSESGAHLWAETYERQLTASNLFAVQDDVTGKIVATLADSHGVIVRAGLEEAGASRTENLDVYDCLLRHNEFRRHMSAEKHLIARECLERSVALDPNYAEAWARLANVYAVEYAQPFNPRPDQYDALERAQEAGQTAAELDPANEWARLALARTHFFRREPDRLFLEAERAVELNPNNADVLASVGWYVAHAGKWDRGLELMERAMELSPFYPPWYYQPFVDDHYRKGEYEAALARARQMNLPGSYWTYMNLASIYGQMGQDEEARIATEKLVAIYPSFATDAHALLRKWYLSEDHLEQVIDGLRKAGIDILDETVASD